MTILNQQIVKKTPRPIKIIQFGEGNFLRGFVDWMFEIINEKTDFNGNVQIVQPLQNGMGKLINQQNGLYNVLLEGIEQNKTIQNYKLITCVKGVINPYEDYNSYLELAKNPDLEFIVSNTTESGINFDSSDSDWNKVPNTFPGKLTALLFKRFEHYKANPPKNLTILPCELIENNGDALKKCILNYGAHWNLPPQFIHWISNQVTFCNTLVDRIVPGYPASKIESIQKILGYKDQLVVNAEHYHLWAIEGPEALKDKLKISETKLNIVITNNLQKYRTQKVRILNGAHTAMVGYGLLNGFEKVKELIEHKIAGDFIKNIIFNEIIPSIEMDKKTLEAYSNSVIERFQNPFISHFLKDISLNSISKFKVRVLPSILSYLNKTDEVPVGLSTAFAYIIYLYNPIHKAKNIVIKDDPSVLDFFNTVWNEEDKNIITLKVLSNKNLWGEDLNKYQILANFISQKLEIICSKTRILIEN